MKKTACMMALLLLLTSTAACGVKEQPEESGTAVTQTQDVSDIVLKDTSFLGAYENSISNIPFVPSKISPSVANYEIKPDLSNIANIKEFGTFTKEQTEALVNNGFVICATKPVNGEFTYDQIFQLYDQNSYDFIPSFVTGDSMTHIFHIFYDFLLRDIEKNQLFTKLQDMTAKLLASNIETYNKLTNEKMKELQLKNVAYFGVAARLADLKNIKIPSEAQGIVEAELRNIEAKTLSDSHVVNDKLDYSQFTVRGHYTRDKTLEKYFMTTMYYGQLGFYPFRDDKMDEAMVLRAMLISDSVYKDKTVFETWSEVTDPIDYLVESAEDLTVRDYGKILYGIYGRNPDLNQLDNPEDIKKAARLIQALPVPVIAPAKGRSFRFIPQRAVMDSVLMQNIIEISTPEQLSRRPIYSGLDLMTAFGSKKAKEIQYADPYNRIWDQYEKKTEENIKTVQSFTEEDWQKNMYRGWLWMLTSYTQEFEEGYPMFMRNDAWRTKDLASALGSWAELKRDTVLYGKQVSMQMGGGYEDELPIGYVEPNLELFEKLSWLLKNTKENLLARDLLEPKGAKKLEQFQELTDECIRLIKKQLSNERFTDEEKQSLFEIGGRMESICISFVEGDQDQLRYWSEIENDADRRMPIIADLMTTAENAAGIPPNKVLSAASGAPNEIYVVYPQNGKLYMGRGGVFSYHEFLSDNRQTDEEWQETLLRTGHELPAWEKEIVHDKKSEIPGGAPIGY